VAIEAGDRNVKVLFTYHCMLLGFGKSLKIPANLKKLYHDFRTSELLACHCETDFKAENLVTLNI
jgi:hypothetical protein